MSQRHRDPYLKRQLKEQRVEGWELFIFPYDKIGKNGIYFNFKPLFYILILLLFFHLWKMTIKKTSPYCMHVLKGDKMEWWENLATPPVKQERSAKRFLFILFTTFYIFQLLAYRYRNTYVSYNEKKSFFSATSCAGKGKFCKGKQSCTYKEKWTL